MYDLLLQNFPVVTCFSRLPCYPAFLLHVKYLSIWQEFHYRPKNWRSHEGDHWSIAACPQHIVQLRDKNIGDFLQAAKSGDVLAILEQGKSEKRVGEKYEVSSGIDKGTEEQNQILYIMFWHQHTHLCQTSECLDCMLHLLSLHRADCYYVQLFSVEAEVWWWSRHLWGPPKKFFYMPNIPKPVYNAGIHRLSKKGLYMSSGCWLPEIWVCLRKERVVYQASLCDSFSARKANLDRSGRRGRVLRLRGYFWRKKILLSDGNQTHCFRVQTQHDTGASMWANQEAVVKQADKHIWASGGVVV